MIQEFCWYYNFSEEKYINKPVLFSFLFENKLIIFIDFTCQANLEISSYLN